MTSENVQNAISFNIYDRASETEAFLGTLDIKPIFKHDHTVDQWYKCVWRHRARAYAQSDPATRFRLLPHESEPVTGEIRIQITYEQYKVRRLVLTG